jgi:phosphoribosylaminoimidazole-succinocarboxamide synthase
VASTQAVFETQLPGCDLRARGKVRDVYNAGDHLVIVATDRLSAFDYILPTPIPDKGRVLTQTTLFWLGLLKGILPNHFVSANVEDYPDPFPRYRDQLEGRSMLVRRANMIEVECVARGYVSGSGWKDYQKTGGICGIDLPAGLRESDKLPEPIFTPATKAQTGHDENIDRAAGVALVGEQEFDEAERLSLALYGFVSEYAAERGIILADTKLEFGVDEQGRLVLGDEAFTPDSSRFWPADEYTPGGPQPSFDKQFVRDYCESLGWDKTYPGPELPTQVVAGTRARYIEAFERLTEIPFADYDTDPGIVLS